MKLPENFQSNFPLKKVSTFGIGGPARYYTEVRSIEEIVHTLRLCHENNLPFFILGKGSNSLFDDAGFNGVVIANRIDFISKPSDDIWHVGAGYSFSLLGTQTARQGWSGLEFASGIPASVGGAIFMNAGANGHETCDNLISVDFVTPEGHLVSFARSELTFSYRHSSFQAMPGAIVGATFQLIPSSTARDEQIELIRYRQKTQPYGDKSAGCVFRNPPNHSAGALIDKSGLKGVKFGGAQVSTLHANFVINSDEASSQDVLNIIQLIRTEVKQHTGIELESEIRYIPYEEEPSRE